MLSVDLNNSKRQYYKFSVDSQLAIIESWMTSLKKHTVDYNENTFLNVKNIPTRYTSWCGSELINEMGILNNNNSNNSNNLSAVNYRNNDHQLIKDDVTSKRLCQVFNIILSDDSIYSIVDNKVYQLNNKCVNSKNDSNNNNSFTILHNQNNYGKNFDLNNCLYNLCLSLSLNQIVISYDDKLKFLIKNRFKYNIKGRKNLVKKYFRLLKYIDSKDDSKQINYYLKKQIENFSLNYKKTILDYEVKCVKLNNVTDVNLTIGDFVKTECDCSKIKKNFSDFCITAVDDSRTNNNSVADMSGNKSSGLATTPDTNRVLRRDTVTKNRIKNLNIYRNAMGYQKVNENVFNYENDDVDDNIYQPIWKFQTIGSTPDNDETPLQASLAMLDDVSDSDNWSNAEDDFAFQNLSFIDENDNSLEYMDASSNDKTSDHINSDSNNNNNNDNNNSKCDDKIISSPYSKVTIFYSLTDNGLNKINYSDVNNSINNRMNIKEIHSKINEQICSRNYSLKTNNYNKTLKNILNSKLPKNITNWQLSLLNYNLIEDEEDVIMTEQSVTKSNLQAIPSRFDRDVNVMETSFTEPKLFGFVNPKSISVTEKIPGIDSSPEGKFTPNKFVDGFEYIPNDNASETTSLKSLSTSLKESPKYSPTNSEKKLEKLKAKEKERKKEKDKVFGVDLDKVELDVELGVPKFIVECIKIIEEEENIETNGIYRASGNKNNIENIKKKMNEKRYMSKESKYTYLQNQDLHTITGALKLFFRETSDLIPEEVFANLPKSLSCKENLETVKTQINTLDEVRFETLKYLMKHLRKVHEKNSKNLMTSSNLSIIWGASLFTKSVNSIMSLIENDIMNRNVLIRVLIDNYDYVFNENLFSSDSASPNKSTNNDEVVNQR